MVKEFLKSYYSKKLVKDTENYKKQLVSLQNSIFDDISTVTISDVMGVEIDFGVLVNRYMQFYETFGYPEKDDNGEKYCHYELCNFVPGLGYLKILTDRLWSFFDVRDTSKSLCSLLSDINMRCEIGEYSVLDNQAANHYKKKFLCDLVGCYYDTLIKNKDFSVKKYTPLLDSYERYVNFEGYDRWYGDNKVYAPQFAEYIVPLMNELFKIAYGDEMEDTPVVLTKTFLKEADN